MTLVEMLIVLAIVGIGAAAVALVLGPGRGPGPEAEARRLAARLDLAADRALATGRPVRLVWDGGGYGFETWADAAAVWTPLIDPESGLARRDLPGGVALHGAAGALVVAPDGAGTAMVWTLARGRDAWRVAFDGLAARPQPGHGPQAGLR